jgi:hypothetical protein
MAEPSYESDFQLQGPAARAPEASQSNAAYLELVDRARKFVAISMVICGPGFAICNSQFDYVFRTLRREPGIWLWGCRVFGIGVLACLIATFALIVEYLARPAAPKSFTLRSVIVRSFLILIMAVAVCYAMNAGFGPEQATGTVVGILLGLAAARERRIVRAVLAVLAVIVIGLTFLGMQTKHQYMCRHADEIVAAAGELMDQCPGTRDGRDVAVDDARVPEMLRNLGASHFLVKEKLVVVYVDGFPDIDIRSFRRNNRWVGDIQWRDGKGSEIIRAGITPDDDK